MCSSNPSSNPNLDHTFNTMIAHAAADFEGAAASPKADNEAEEGGAGEGEGDLAPSFGSGMVGLPVMSAVDLTRVGGEFGSTVAGNTRGFSTADNFFASSSMPGGQTGADGFTGGVNGMVGGTEVRGDIMQNPAFSAFGLDYDGDAGTGDADLFNETGAAGGSMGGTGTQ